MASLSDELVELAEDLVNNSAGEVWIDRMSIRILSLAKRVKKEDEMVDKAVASLAGLVLNRLQAYKPRVTLNVEEWSRIWGEALQQFSQKEEEEQNGGSES